MNGIFVTGTDTGVGKTIISCGLAAVFKEKKMDTGVFKPFLSGISRYDPESDTYLMKQMSQTPLSIEDITPFEFKEPLAPYVAGKLEGKEVRIEEVLCHCERISKRHEYFIVEGAGGISVPLAESLLVSDLIKALQMPILIVARPDLGTINHTFLTVQYATSIGLKIAGIVINGMSDRLDLAVETNPRIIEELCGVPIVGITPKLEELTKESVQKMVSDNLDITLLMDQWGVGK
ncbi:dethiobiotin synthetase [Geomicrobium halophilum]|uniref:ATP-dependent dethiobiotin synthetase BioD n=1 Tax=Geomicrobium halophilum TaxID=549000 RepID=A0A841PUV1_9BACL|nr:dethiobiotin synthase [Geomicrobium halophilum]MBB6450081.1 dethiobiotin synthetase [Geomicrobium halophilum]